MLYVFKIIIFQLKKTKFSNKGLFDCIDNMQRLFANI